jgi:uncharacterized delta-60 repeat protein
VGRFDDAGGMALQHIGGLTKIVIAGHVYEPSWTPPHRIFVVRLNPDGSLDTDVDADPAVHLDHDGMATAPFPDEALGGAVTIDSTNRIVLAGYTDIGPNDVPAVARLQADGAPDPFFGDGGFVVLAPEGRAGRYFDVAVDPTAGADRIVLAGLATASRGYNWLVSRLEPDGSADPSFGDGDGHEIFPMRARRVAQSFERASGVAVGGDGTLTVVGRYRVWGQDETDGPANVPAMVRLEPDGDFDPTFSTNGKARLARSTGGVPSRDAEDVIVDADGTAYWVGSRFWPTGGEQEWVLVGGRTPDGNKDLRFGPEGSLAVSWGPSGDTGQALALDASGRLVAAGRADPVGGASVRASFGVARLQLS